MPNNIRFFKKIGVWLDERFYQIVIVTSALVLNITILFWSLLGLDESVRNAEGFWCTAYSVISSHLIAVILIVVSSAFTIIFTWLHIGLTTKTGKENKLLRGEVFRKNIEIDKSKARINDLEQEIIEKQSGLLKSNEDAVNSLLLLCIKELMLSHNERVSIYYHKDDVFYILGRRALNPTFQKTHKQSFPLDGGVISLAWNQGEFCDNLSCRYDDKPEDYIRFSSEKYKYTKKAIEKLTMKSCSYFALSIKHNFHGALGVVVFESLELNKFTENTTAELKNFINKITDLLVKSIEDAKELSVDYNSTETQASAKQDELDMLNGGSK